MVVYLLYEPMTFEVHIHVMLDLSGFLSKTWIDVLFCFFIFAMLLYLKFGIIKCASQRSCKNCPEITVIWPQKDLTLWGYTCPMEVQVIFRSVMLNTSPSNLRTRRLKFYLNKMLLCIKSSELSKS